MPIAVQCPTCQARLSAPDAAAGKQVKCAKCQAVLTIPTPPADGGFEVVEDAPAADSGFEVVDPPPARPKAAAKKAAVVVADDGEERPARRRPKVVADDDEDDDRPRRKRPKKSEAKGRGFLGHPLVMLIGGGLGVVVAAWILWYVYTSRQAEADKAPGKPAGAVDLP